MKKLLYLYLKKDMVKKLSKNCGCEMVDYVMRIFEMPTNKCDEYLKSLEQTQCKSQPDLKQSDYIEVAERLYKHVNPTSKMNCPNSVYITTEKWYKEWQNIETDLDLFDWCVKFKNK
jgi:hypothetical protein